MTGLVMPIGWLTDGEIKAELVLKATAADRREALEAEKAERRAIRASMGREAAQAAAGPGALAVTMLGLAP